MANQHNNINVYHHRYRCNNNNWMIAEQDGDNISQDGSWGHDYNYSSVVTRRYSSNRSTISQGTFDGRAHYRNSNYGEDNNTTNNNFYKNNIANLRCCNDSRSYNSNNNTCNNMNRNQNDYYYNEDEIMSLLDYKNRVIATKDPNMPSLEESDHSFNSFYYDNDYSSHSSSEHSFHTANNKSTCTTGYNSNAALCREIYVQKPTNEEYFDSNEFHQDTKCRSSTMVTPSYHNYIEQPCAKHSSVDMTMKKKSELLQPRNIEIEISSGVYKRVRGANETKEAIEHDFYMPSSCPCCTDTVFCIQDCDYVLCPDCRIVIPLEEQTHECHDGGIGLGFKLNYLLQYQQQILQQQRDKAALK